MEDGKCDDEGDGEPKAEGSTCWGMRSDTPWSRSPRRPNPKTKGDGAKNAPVGEAGRGPNCNG